MARAIVKFPGNDAEHVILRLAWQERVDNPIFESLVLPVPHLQTPEVPALAPLTEPFAHMKIGRPVIPEVVLREAIENVLISFQFLEQNPDSGGSYWSILPEFLKICFGVSVDKQAYHYIDLDIIRQAL